MESNPRAVFERLFGDGDSTDPAVRRARRQQDQSILDAVTEKIATCSAMLGPRDRAKLGEYLDAVRDVETPHPESRDPERPRPAGASSSRRAASPAIFEDYVKLMFDLQVLAYQADMTRVITFMLTPELSASTYPEIGVPDPHHGLSHHQNNPDNLAKLTKVNMFHIKLFAYYLDKLAATPDGDGSLLDSALIVYGSGMSDSNVHDIHNLPILLARRGIGTDSGQPPCDRRGGNAAHQSVHDVAQQAECPGRALRRQHRDDPRTVRGVSQHARARRPVCTCCARR